MKFARTPTRLVPLPLLVRAGAVTASLLMAIAATRSLSQVEAGHFFTMFAVSVAASTAGRFGTDTEALKAAASNALDTGALSSLLRICTSRLACACILVYPASSYVLGTQYWSWNTAALAFPTAAATLTSGLAVFLGSALRGAHHISRGILVETAIAHTGTALLAFGSTFSTASGALWAYSLCNLFAAGIGAIWIRDVTGTATPRPIPHGLSAETSRAALAGTATLFYCLTYAPVLTLGFTGNPEASASFSVAARVANLINLIPVIQNSYITPMIARAYARCDSDAINKISTRASRRAIMFALPIATIFSIFPQVVTFLFGPQYADSSSAMQILALGAALTIYFGPVNPILMTTGRELLAVGLAAALLLITIVGIATASATAGLTEVAAVSATASITYAAVTSIALARIDGRRTMALGHWPSRTK